MVRRETTRSFLLFSTLTLSAYRPNSRYKIKQKVKNQNIYHQSSVFGLTTVGWKTVTYPPTL